MNIKPTLLKVIISIIVLIVVDLILASQVICLDAPCSLASLALEPILVLFGAIAFIIIYLILSLLNK